MGGQTAGQVIDFIALPAELRHPTGTTVEEGFQDGSSSKSQTAGREAQESQPSQDSEERWRNLYRL